MCGLVLLAGPDSQNLIAECTNRIKHRGPDAQSILIDGNLSIGFRRLAINGDSIEGQQPYSKCGWIAAINGEIFNHEELVDRFHLEFSACDTKVILPLFLSKAEDVVDLLDGFYAGVLVAPDRINAYCIRDPIGKKPLFVGAVNGVIFITSELKAIQQADWFSALPKGLSQVNLITGNITFLRRRTTTSVGDDLPALLSESVRKRLPNACQPVAVFLSGGLDSSLIASIASKLRDDITYFTLGNSNGGDLVSAQEVIKALGLKKVINIPLPDLSALPDLIAKLVFITESYNPSIISNGLATYVLAQAARKAGIKVVLTGEGADELFGGYHHFKNDDPWQSTRQKLIDDMEFTELRRLDLSCMANSIEPRCPFLDVSVKSYSDGLGYSQLYNNKLNKVSLRRCFVNYLPEKILLRQKTSCDVGSGVRSMVVRYLKRNGRTEREELLRIWKRHFNFESNHHYFHSYPTFDSAIDLRGEYHR